MQRRRTLDAMSDSAPQPGPGDAADPASGAGASPDPDPVHAQPSTLPPTGPAAEPSTLPPHAGLRYATLRLVMLVAVAAVLYLVGMRSWPWLFASVLISAVLSFFVFLRQREAAARSLEAAIAARSAKHAAATEGVSVADPQAAPAEVPGAARESAREETAREQSVREESVRE